MIGSLEAFKLEKILPALFLIQLALCGIFGQRASAADLNAFAGAAVGQNYFSSLAPNSGLGFGTQVTAGIGGLIGLEWGVLYVGECSSYGAGASNYSITQRFLDVPVMLRVSPVKYLYLLGGAYYGWGVGTDEYFASGGGVSSSKVAAKHDYGAIGGVSLQVPFNDQFRLRLESTYQRGTANISNTPSYVERSRVLTFWIGGQFAFDWKLFHLSVGK